MSMNYKHERSNNSIERKVRWKPRIPEPSYTSGKSIDIHVLVTPYFKLLLEYSLVNFEPLPRGQPNDAKIRINNL